MLIGKLLYTMEYDTHEGKKSLLVRGRSYAPTELVMLFRQAEFEVEHVWGGAAGDWGRRKIHLDEMEIMVVARKAANIRLTVCDDPQQATIQPQVEADTEVTTTLYTGEHTAYHHIAETGRGHATVCHSRKEWARDDDGDGIREVHCNTMEGIWTGLRNFLRPFRGVHKKFLTLYVAIFEWAHNLKCITSDCLRSLMAPNFTLKPT